MFNPSGIVSGIQYHIILKAQSLVPKSQFTFAYRISLSLTLYISSDLFRLQLLFLVLYMFALFFLK